MTLTFDTTTGLADMGPNFGENCRKIAVETSTAAAAAVYRGLVESIAPKEEFASEQILFAGEDHQGARPISLDVMAQKAGWSVAEEALKELAPNREIIPAGEEADGGIRLVGPGNIICRQDPLDGSTNARVLWSNFASVTTIDEVRSVSEGSERARHWAGAIVGNGFTVSWVNLGNFDRSRQRYNRVQGRVYLSAPAWAVPEFELDDVRFDRKRGTVASVAAAVRRFDSLVLALGGTLPNVMYNVAGNPLAAALLAGEIESVIETNNVSLHDSAFLIPFQLLGGQIRGIDGFSEFDYLRAYEKNAVHLDRKDKPIPGYWARAGIDPVMGS